MKCQKRQIDHRDKVDKTLKKKKTGVEQVMKIKYTSCVEISESIHKK